jgi:peptide/nickel transport system permease protein
MESNFWKYAVRRVLQGGLVFFLLMFVFATIAHVQLDVVERSTIQRDAIQAAGRVRNSTPGMTNEEYDALYHSIFETMLTQRGMNGPLIERVWRYAMSSLTFNFGETIITTIQGYGNEKSNQVVDVIFERVPPTVMLFGGAFVVQIIVAIFLGLRNARRPGTLVDRTTAVVGIAGLSSPTMVVAMFAVLLFVFAIRIFPSDPWVLRYPHAWSEVGPWIWEFVTHYTLPFLTLVAIGFGSWAFAFRNIMIGTMQEDFVTAARARGIPERKVLFGHVARTSAPPLVTAVAYGFAGTLWGGMLVEAIFQWPGIGSLYLLSIKHAMGLTLFLGITVFITAVYITATVVLDLLYGFLDPRIKVGSSQKR